MDEWRKVSSQKPPNGLLVLACDMKSMDLVTAFRVVWRVADEWFTTHLTGTIDAPTHWIEIPDAPETVEDSEPS